MYPVSIFRLFFITTTIEINLMINHTSRSSVGGTVSRFPMLRVAAYSLVCLLFFDVSAPLQAAVVVQQDAASLTLSNSKVVLKINKSKPWFSITYWHDTIPDIMVMVSRRTREFPLLQF
jgi:hypothetical protein